MLVVRTNRTTRSNASSAYESLKVIGASLLGAIVNAMPMNAGTYGYYGTAVEPRSGLAASDGFLEDLSDEDTQLQLPDDALQLTPRGPASNGHAPSPTHPLHESSVSLGKEFRANA